MRTKSRSAQQPAGRHRSHRRIPARPLQAYARSCSPEGPGQRREGDPVRTG